MFLYAQKYDPRFERQSNDSGPFPLPRSERRAMHKLPHGLLGHEGDWKRALRSVLQLSTCSLLWLRCCGGMGTVQSRSRIFSHTNRSSRSFMISSRTNEDGYELFGTRQLMELAFFFWIQLKCCVITAQLATCSSNRIPISRALDIPGLGIIRRKGW